MNTEVTDGLICTPIKVEANVHWTEVYGDEVSPGCLYLIRAADDVNTDHLLWQHRLRVDPIQASLQLCVLGQRLNNTIE